MNKIGRNDPCPCGSGKKYKQCCLPKENIRSGTGDQRRGAQIENLLQEAVQHHQAGRLNQAETLYRQILQSDPRHPDALNLLGLIAHQSGRKDLAVEWIGQAIQIRPDIANYRYNRGVSYQELGRLLEAIEDYRAAVRLNPDYFEAYENLGVALRDAGEYSAAIEAIQKALAIRADSPLAHNNLALLFKQKGDFGGAIAEHREALRCDPVHAEAHKNLGLSLVREKQFEEGWKEYEWRLYSREYVARSPVRIIPFPKWDGSSLDGRTILVRPEQGVGDEIMFASCLPDLIRSAKLCVVECDPRLVNLLSRSFPSALCVPVHAGDDLTWVGELPPIDCWIPSGSLPRHFRKSLQSFTSQTGYLSVDEGSRQVWQDRLMSLGGATNIGITWRGGADERARLDRSIPLAMWSGLFQVPGINFINLQYGDHRQEIRDLSRACGGRLVSFEEIDPLRELDEFAALISALDLVISIDNSTIHLAGALGRPVWTLLPFPADWRWFRPEDLGSYWYPSMKLFRRPGMELESWAACMNSVLDELKNFCGEKMPKVTSGQSYSPENLGEVSEPAHDLLALGSGNAGTPKRALFLNDTSFWYHWGCSCTSLVIHEQLRANNYSVLSFPVNRLHELKALPTSLQGFDDQSVFDQFCRENRDAVDLLHRADVVVVNGEGTLHGISQASLGLIYLIYIAKTRLGKAVQVINHSCYPENTTVISESPAYQLYRKVYRQLDFVAVREETSANLLEAMGIPVTRSFDCLPLFVRNHYVRGEKRDEKRIVIAGGVTWGREVAASIGSLAERTGREGYRLQLLMGSNAYPASDDLAFARMLRNEIGRNVELVNATSEIDWLNTIHGASLLVSGRFHHSIAAACLDTPFIVTESNTPKTGGLMRMLGRETAISLAGANQSEKLYRQAIRLIQSPSEGQTTPEVMDRIIGLSLKNFEGFIKK